MTVWQPHAGVLQGPAHLRQDCAGPHGMAHHAPVVAQYGHIHVCLKLGGSAY